MTKKNIKMNDREIELVINGLHEMRFDHLEKLSRAVDCKNEALIQIYTEELNRINNLIRKLNRKCDIPF